MEFDRKSIEWAKMQFAADRDKFRQQIAFAKKWTWRLLLLPFVMVVVLVPFETWVGESVRAILVLLATVPGLLVYLRLDSWKLRIRRAEDELKGVISVGDKLHRDWKALMVYAVGTSLYFACFVVLVFTSRHALPWVAAGVWVCISVTILWNTYRYVYVD